MRTVIRNALVVFVWLLAALSPARATGPADVMVVATMHGMHAKSQHYSYDTLYALLKTVNPDYVGVEIRAEDMARDRAYLAKNYPAEMIEAAQQWGPRAFGFDWLGDDVAGAPVPADWWKVRSPIKQLERALDTDPAFKSERMDAIQTAEMAILPSATPASLNDGRYDKLSDEYYALFDKLMKGSKYQMLADFYRERDRHIDMNIAAAIKAHPGARFVILTGGDHRSALVRYLKATLGDDVRLVAVP